MFRPARPCLPVPSESVQQRSSNLVEPSIGVVGVIAIGGTDGGAATAIAAIAAMAMATTDTAGADRRSCCGSVAIVTAAGGAVAGDIDPATTFKLASSLTGDPVEVRPAIGVVVGVAAPALGAARAAASGPLLIGL